MKHFEKKVITTRVITRIMCIVLTLSSLSGCASTDSVESKVDPMIAFEQMEAASEEELVELASKWYDVEKEHHTELDFSDIKYEPIDEQADDAIINRAREDAANNAEARALIEDYDELIWAIDNIATQYYINDYYYQCDVRKKEYADLESALNAYMNDYYDESVVVILEMLNSKNGEDLKEYIDNADLVEEYLEHESMTDEQKELDKRKVDLQLQIKLAMAEDYPASGYLDYYKAKNAVVVPLYIELIGVLNDIAHTYDYDNYAEYAYEEIYNRDFSTEEIKSVYSDVKKNVVPLNEKLNSRLVDNDELSSYYADQEERIASAGIAIANIDPALWDAWEYFLNHHTYDLEYSDIKSGVGFTSELYTYNIPFIFDSPYGNYEDLYTIVHEFGHYNNSFHTMSNYVDSNANVDVCEIQSQGLELLSFEYADVMFGEENARAARSTKLSDMLNAVILGCLYDEFQIALFSYEDELDVSTVNKIFTDIACDYGLEYLTEEGETYFWIDISHTFQSPLYYIAYATSALAALDIFAMSLDNRAAAIDCYMDISAQGQETTYVALLEDTGLPNVFEEGNIEDICIAIEDYIDTLMGFKYAYK